MSAISRGSDHLLESHSPTTLGVFKTKEQSQRPSGRRFVMSERAAIPAPPRSEVLLEEIRDLLAARPAS
jgi:hypothetical protein